MNSVDSILENLQKEVELYGRSGLESVYADNLQFSIPAEGFTTPIQADEEAGIGDVAWFFACARKGQVVPCPNPDRSFWVKFFGKDALPYGLTWNVDRVLGALKDDSKGRRAVLCNGSFGDSPPCILSYQFQQLTYGQLDLTVTMRSSDVANVLAQDVLMSRVILENFAEPLDLDPGKMTFCIANAHVFYKDMLYAEEYTIDYGN